MKTRNLVPVLTLLALSLACWRGPGTIRELVPSPSGARHAALVVIMGGATVGASWYVVVLEGDPPPLGSEIPMRRCILWKAYNVGPWKMTWESENQLALAIDGPIRKDYEEMIDVKTCNGISARWYFEDEPGGR